VEYKNDPLFWLLLHSANTGGKIDGGGINLFRNTTA
jgi:hypothetical protein